MGELIRYLTPFWGWSQDPVNATILKIDDEDEIPLKLDTSDVLEPTHKVTRVKKYVNGVLEECPGEESMKIGEFQLQNGHVKDFHKRKSLEAQRLQSIQQELVKIRVRILDINILNNLNNIEYSEYSNNRNLVIH